MYRSFMTQHPKHLAVCLQVNKYDCINQSLEILQDKRTD